MSLFNQVAEVSKPRVEPIRMYKFKKNIDDKDDDMYTVTATSLGAAIQKAPEMLTWFLHSVSK